MTLTYDDDHLPVTQTLFSREKSTGIETPQTAPEFCSTGYHPVKEYCDLFRDMVVSDQPRYHSMFVMDDGVLNIMRASLRRSVVPTSVPWLKQARIQYKRDNGVSLPDFSYVAISGVWSQDLPASLSSGVLWSQERTPLLSTWTDGRWEKSSRFGLSIRLIPMVRLVSSRRRSILASTCRRVSLSVSVTCGASERPRVCQSLPSGYEQLGVLCSVCAV